MNIARCRVRAVSQCAVNLGYRPITHPTRRLISSSLPSLKVKKVRQSLDFDSLPKSKLDSAGQPLAPLEPYKEYKKKAHHAPSVEYASQEEESYRRAVAEGDVPDTALAKQVYLNWKRFPDCIVLTRVGKFYEVRQIKSDMKFQRD
jgi:hypothetical protein